MSNKMENTTIYKLIGSGTIFGILCILNIDWVSRILIWMAVTILLMIGLGSIDG